MLGSKISHYAANVVATTHLRAMSGEEIVRDYSGRTRHEFAAARQLGRWATHVVIPVFNEQDDLPATLLALARNTHVVPLVMLNNCTDNTGAVAERMGAQVEVVPYGRKMAATKAGIWSLRAKGISSMAFTDGDTLPLPTWASTMMAHVRTADSGSGAAVYGSCLTWNGASRGADALITTSQVLGDSRRARRQRVPVARGSNYALSFDKAGLMDAAIDRLDDDLFFDGQRPPDDFAIQQAMRYETEAAVVGLASPDAHVITRGDRVDTLRKAVQLAIMHRPYAEVVAPGYTTQYTDHQPPMAA